MKPIFQAALERGRDERASFLTAACGGDPTLRGEVESLLAAHEQASDTVEAVAGQVATQMLASNQAVPFVRQQIGPYRIVREIGQGGMGAVYLAARADDQYKRHVAIKLIKRGMDTDFIVRRFLSERQILAALNHPNIARLYDGGTTEDGLPYFVMEYIEGQPIYDYCDANRLNTADRLRLFRGVCAAAQYAHQNLIIHRDIKPGNILVTADGVPKLLDFGIAKLLNPELAGRTLDPTAPTVGMMTPEYASPEQVRGEPITTASDVYSLGVLLYELLTGHRPYRVNRSLPHEMARVICEEEPQKPSAAITRVEEVDTADGRGRITLTPESVSETGDGQPEKLRRRLAGDIDNIVLKALNKEPQRRYSSVEQFSEDIRRHLEGLPVRARQDTLSYRAGKFIKRHKAGVIAAAVIALTLLAGIVGTTWQAIVARSERARAERRFNDVRKLANSFMFEIHDGIERLSGSTAVREALVKRALEYLDSLAQESANDPSLRRELATAYQKVGDIQQGNPGMPSLGDIAGALESHHKSLALRESLAAADPANVDIGQELTMSYLKVGNLLKRTGKTTEALEMCRKDLPVTESLLAANPANPNLRRRLTDIYAVLGSMLADTGDTTGALEKYRQSLAISETLAAEAPADAEARRDLMVAYLDVGDSLKSIGNIAEALDNYCKAEAIAESLSAANLTNAQARRDLSVIYERVGDALAFGGDMAGALASHRKSLAINEALAAADPQDLTARSDVAVSHEKVGKMLTATGDLTGALAHHRKALEIRAALAAADPSIAIARSDLANSHTWIGIALAETGNTLAALQSHRKALAINREMTAADPADAQARGKLAESYAYVGDMLMKLGDMAGARECYHEALAIEKELSAADPASILNRMGLANMYSRFGHLFSALASSPNPTASKRADHWREARQWYQQSYDTWASLRDGGPLSGEEANKPDELAREIARCDAALAKLKKK